MTDRAALMLKLPAYVYVWEHEGAGRVAIVRRGVTGFFPFDTRQTPDDLNALIDPPPSRAQVLAMGIGSIFGWNVPGANPENHT